MSLLWVGASAVRPWSHERILPTGNAHLCIRACGTPIRLGLDGGQVEKHGVLGGPRSRSHIHDCPASRSVGAVFAPGALPAFFAVSARSVAERHTGLAELWGADAIELSEQLAEADDPAALDRLEAVLVAQLRPTPPRAGLAQAIRALAAGARVDDVARALGRSPRTLSAWFDERIGVSPRRWGRLQRLQRALDLAQREPDGAVVAQAAGYFDQAHLCRDMRDLAGITLSTWRAHRPGQPNHVPCG